VGLKIGKFFKRALGGVVKKPLKTILTVGGLALGGVLGAGAKAAATKLLGKIGLGALAKGKAAKVAPWVVAALGLGAGERKKVTPTTWTPTQLEPYLSPEEINPVVSTLYQHLGAWGGYTPTGIAQTGAATTTDLGQYAALMATRPTDFMTVAATTANLMRPLFEQQLQRQMASLHEQLAAAAGSPQGGSILEALTRFAAEQERGWQSTLADLAIRELARQQEMAQRWAAMTPELFRGALGLMAVPTEMTLRIAEHLRPLYGGAPMYPMYAPSTLEQLTQAIVPWIQAGVIKF